MADTFTHSDGRVCYWLPYTMHGVEGLMHGWFWHELAGAPAKCHREHGLENSEDESNDPT